MIFDQWWIRRIFTSVRTPQAPDPMPPSHPVVLLGPLSTTARGVPRRADEQSSMSPGLRAGPCCPTGATLARLTLAIVFVAGRPAAAGRPIWLGFASPPSGERLPTGASAPVRPSRHRGMPAPPWGRRTSECSDDSGGSCRVLWNGFESSTCNFIDARRRFSGVIGDAQIAHTVDVTLEPVARLDPADALRRAGHDEVARTQRDERAQVADRLGHLPDLLVEVALLARFPVDSKPDGAPGRVADVLHGADLARGRGLVEALRHVPRAAHLLRLRLQVAARHVESHRVPEDVVERPLHRDVAAALCERDHQLDLVVQVLRPGGKREP